MNKYKPSKQEREASLSLFFDMKKLEYLKLKETNLLKWDELRNGEWNMFENEAEKPAYELDRIGKTTKRRTLREELEIRKTSLQEEINKIDKVLEVLTPENEKLLNALRAIGM